jgi:hypothetical protein
MCSRLPQLEPELAEKKKEKKRKENGCLYKMLYSFLSEQNTLWGGNLST